MRVVLVVDDDPVSVQLLEIILTRSGYEVLKANNAEDGLRIVSERKPDVLIIDDMMPDMSGGDMSQQVKANPETQHIPVILISAGNRVNNPNYLTEVKADLALLKPTLPKDVLAAIKEVLGE